MAKIWFVKDGMTGQGDPVSEKPLAWCIRNLGLTSQDWKADLDSGFTVGDKTDLSPYSNSRWVVIQVDEDEAGSKWKTGYYFSPSIKIDRVKTLLS